MIMTYRKTAHPRNSEEAQGWEPTYWNGEQIAHTLTSNNAGGNQRMQDKDNFNCVIQPIERSEYDHAYAEETGRRKILCLVWKFNDEETVRKWSAGIQFGVQQKKVLRQGLHGKSVRQQEKRVYKMVNGALPREKRIAARRLRDLRETQRAGRTPQGWRFPQQYAGELNAYLQELSQLDSQQERFMQDLRETRERIRVLREALSTVQEVGQSKSIQKESAHRRYIVRRLTPLEAERLQGFPDFWTLIPHKGKPMADSARYRMLGNSVAVPCVEFIMGQIKEAVND